MSKPIPLLHDQYYHIYNRGIDGTPLFRERRNYPYFLQRYAHHIQPIAETFAYCLLSNHFHFLVRIRTIDEQHAYHQTEANLLSTGGQDRDGPVFEARDPSRQFNNLFIAYAKAFNKLYQRTGGLFESPFKRELVDSDHYFTYLVAYIHRNPQKHGFVEDFREWPHSSYWSILSDKRTRIERAAVLDWFQGRVPFKEMHRHPVNEAAIEPLIAEDWM
jgi:hypothetical protein